MKASIKKYRVRSLLRRAVKLCFVSCVLLGAVIYGCLPMMGAQTQYLVAATVVALALQGIGLMVIVGFCVVGPTVARWRVNLRHLAKPRYETYPQPQTVVELS